jgi:tRNA pseudouridine55 synthase
MSKDSHQLQVHKINGCGTCLLSRHSLINHTMTPGIHLVHKPVGPTSFSFLRSYIASSASVEGQKRPKTCHGGTLDPFASGLLLILVEPATKLFEHLHAIPKVYEATVRWGTETDNGDLLGQSVSTGDASRLSPSQLEEGLATFVGWRDQIPPATSAKRIGGERAYEKAHRGEVVEMPASKVYLHEAVWLDHDLPMQSTIRITVRGGYYVRALARDLGRLVGCGAHLTRLHRVSIGPWIDPGPGGRVELRGRDILPWAANRVLSDQEVGELRASRLIPQGKLLPADWPLPQGFPDPQAPIRGFHMNRFGFLLEHRDGWLRALTALRGGL